jgi:hypothetical protein
VPGRSARSSSKRHISLAPTCWSWAPTPTARCARRSSAG